MKWIKGLNPMRAIMGRLFLWFWVTFILTAVLAVWGSRLLFQELEVSAASEREIRELAKVEERLQEPLGRRGPLPRLLDRSARNKDYRVIAYDFVEKRFIYGPGIPLNPGAVRDIQGIVNQSAPLNIKRGPLTFLGPIKYSRSGRDYAVFLVKFTSPDKNYQPFVYFFIVALITTTLLSWLFAKSLTRPIIRVQRSTRALASGNWQVRIQESDIRNDELGKLARDFNSMADQLEQLWNGQQRLLADISHELRSPLARLQMALGLAHQQNIDSATLDRIDREAQRMEALIKQLLDLSRVESGKREYQSHKLSLLLQDILTDAQFEAANRNKALDIDTVPSIDIQANGVLLCRAIENVLRNALRHSHYLTKISFDVSESHWSICIQDDGEGLTSEECDRIFAPFYRASLARERESGGVGLGLSIAKAAVDLHDGTIDAKPSENAGLAVTLTFPLRH